MVQWSAGEGAYCSPFPKMREFEGRQGVLTGTSWQAQAAATVNAPDGQWHPAGPQTSSEVPAGESPWQHAAEQRPHSTCCLCCTQPPGQVLAASRTPEPPRAAAASAITSRWGQRLIVQSSSWLESREARSAVGRQLSSSFSRECKVGTAQLADTEGGRTTQKKGIGHRSSYHSTVHLFITCLVIC